MQARPVEAHESDGIRNYEMPVGGVGVDAHSGETFDSEEANFPPGVSNVITGDFRPRAGPSFATRA
jgi:hypothetical protein